MRSHVSRRVLLLAAVVAGSVVGLALPAAATTVVYQHTWNPPVVLTSSYTAGAKTHAGWAQLPFSMNVRGTQSSTLTVTMRTRWVDVKARHDSPNIVQQGLFVAPPLIKLEIGQGSLSSSHRAVCLFIGAHGRQLRAVGPTIDIADGRWHTISCLKSADRRTWTAARVDVDGVKGRNAYSAGPLGNLISSAPVTIGGRTPVASSDSLDGWLTRLVYTTS